MLDCKNPEIQDYLVWVLQHGKNRGGRFQDFCEYLMAVEFTPSVTTDGICFPGSKEVRTFKKWCIIRRIWSNDAFNPWCRCLVEPRIVSCEFLSHQFGSWLWFDVPAFLLGCLFCCFVFDCLRVWKQHPCITDLRHVSPIRHLLRLRVVTGKEAVWVSPGVTRLDRF